MYLKSITLRNIKCFPELKLDFSAGDQARKWTAILGKNGLGKSTILQAIGAALAGPGALRELIPVAEGWTRSDAPYGEIEAELLWSPGDALTPHWPKTKKPYQARYAVTKGNSEGVPQGLAEYTVPVIMDWSGEGDARERERISKDMSRLKQTAYAENKPGWFACGYGPFRRLSGGAQAADRILYSGRKSARFITLFREDAALTNASEWLISLYNTARDGDSSSANKLEQIQKVFQTELLPEPCELVVNAHSALLKINQQNPVPFRDLSDGYRSMLALSIDLLRWASDAFSSEEQNLLEVSGVVLIDEIDAHAHPEWQRQVGHWLRKKFPNLQFIVTTHSPFLAQVADEPGGNIVLTQQGRSVVPRDDVEIVEGWRADQILTDLQELTTTRSPDVETKLKRYQELKQRKVGAPLDAIQKQEYEQLGLWIDKIPMPFESPVERERSQNLEELITQHEDELKELE